MKILINSIFFLLSAVCLTCAQTTPAAVVPLYESNLQGNHYNTICSDSAFHDLEHQYQNGMFIPIVTLNVCTWSDKLALNPFNHYVFDNLEDGSKLFSKILRNSFDLKGLSDTAVSDKLTKEFKDGVKLYTGFRTTLANAVIRRFSFDITTRFDEELHIPEAPFLILFSRDKGLVKGSTLDFSDFEQEAVWATDFTFHYSTPFYIPVLNNFFKFKYGAVGVGGRYVMGHSILQAQTDKGTVNYNSLKNAIEVNSKIHVRTAGVGFHGNWELDNFKAPVAGHGVGLDLGGLLYDDHGAFTVNFQNLGALFWVRDQHDVTYTIKKNDFRVYDLVKAIHDEDKDWDKARIKIFNRDEGNYLPDENDSLNECDPFVTVLPATLSIGYSKIWSFSEIKRKRLRLMSEYAHAAIEYQQALAKGPGRSFIPQFTIGAENGTLRGYLPVQLAFSAGGPEKLASGGGFSVDLKSFLFNLSYKAIGSLIFIPKRGMALSANASVTWGPRNKDKDNDGVFDRYDKCKRLAEDFDNFEDTDGCPDYDNDLDSIPDSLDKCLDIKEDLDGFEDSDGCPDYDNDLDSIPDSLDKCPDFKEDFDGFEDSDGCPDFDHDHDSVPDSLDKCPDVKEDLDGFENNDGCPDYDNDLDSIPDSLDKCPDIKEDFDGFEDSDGCPDFDNDNDRIPDTIDLCVNVSETYNNFNDSDGCPDTLRYPSEKDLKNVNNKLQTVKFKQNTTEISQTSMKALDIITAVLLNYPHVQYTICVDSVNNDSTELFLQIRKALAFKNTLISKGVKNLVLISGSCSVDSAAVPKAGKSASTLSGINALIDYVVTPAEFTQYLEKEKQLIENSASVNK